MMSAPVTTAAASIASGISGVASFMHGLLAQVCNFGWVQLIDDLPVG